MKRTGAQRGIALITVLGIMGLFLLVALLLLEMTSQNSTNFGNAYQKQRYYDVAEAGIDRGLSDLDSVLPSPGSTGSPAPAPAPPAPSVDQTPLPGVPNVSYHYSYWVNPAPSPTSTADPLAGSTFGVSSGHIVNVPASGAVIWSYTRTGLRDVAVEAVVDRFGTSAGNCALCAGQSITVTGSQNFSPPSGVCGSLTNPDKVCSDPRSSPSPAPSSVPIVAGGAYNCSGAAANAAPCAYGDGTSTPNPAMITQNASPGTLSGFLAPQGTIDALGDSAVWQLLSTTSSNVQWIDCTAGCDTPALTSVAPTAGQVTFVLGNVNLSSKTVLSYGGMFIISGCLNISQPGMQGTTSSATTIVLGTDAACGGDAINIQGGGGTKPPLWDGGIAYAAQGSISIAGNGSVRGYNFYGAAIAANNITVSGNGFFAWQSATLAQSFALGPFAPVSFAQY